MSRASAAGWGTVCFTLLHAVAAQADVTADQVWQAWKDQYHSYGYTLNAAAQDRSGPDLVLHDVKMDGSVEGGSVSLDMPELRLHEQGDGTVAISIPQDVQAHSSSHLDGEPPVDLTLVLRLAQISTVASGDPGAISYQSSGPAAEIELNEASTTGGKQIPLRMLMRLAQVSGRYSTDAAKDNAEDSEFSIGSMQITGTGADPDGRGTFSLHGTFADLQGRAHSTRPDGVDMTDVIAAAQAGAVSELQLSYGAASYGLEGSVEGKDSRFAGEAGGGALHFALGPQGLKYDSQVKALKLDASVPDLPMPVSAGIAGLDSTIEVPLDPDGGAQPFTGKLMVDRLTLSDSVWGLFDPKGQLPRDPADLKVDLQGMATPGQMTPEALAMGAPFELDALKISTLQAHALGAALSGSGDLSFTSMMGVPVPQGKVHLRVDGASGLLDKLVAMGVIPEDQAMFARMISGVYARQTGDDSLETDLEFKENGEVLANGQRIQ